MDCATINNENNNFVYRIQNSAGVGCYTGTYESKLLEYHNDVIYHPMPLQDKGIKRHVKVEELCGFLNLEQVFNWFNKNELIMLKNLGYYLVRLQVKEITAIGEKQVLFIPLY